MPAAARHIDCVWTWTLFSRHCIGLVQAGHLASTMSFSRRLFAIAMLHDTDAALAGATENSSVILTTTRASFYGFAGPYFILIALQASGVLEFNTQIHILMIVMCYLIITDVTVYSRCSWNHAVGSGTRNDVSAKRKGTVLDQAKLNSRRITNSLRGAAVAVCASVDSYASKWHCSAEIMKSTYLNAAFAAHVERYTPAAVRCKGSACIALQSLRAMTPVVGNSTDRWHIHSNSSVHSCSAQYR
eukprot:12115-Heterococcus_DN1.PRE.2